METHNPESAAKFTILVGTDFAAAADRAFSQAVSMARRISGRLEVVHVVPSSVSAPIELFTGAPDMDGLARARHHLDDYLAYAAVEGVSIGAHIRMGHPADELLAAIEELKPDLVVMGSRDLGLVARTLLGSVSHTVSRASKSVRGSAKGAAHRVAWSCRDCGHIFGAVDRVARCGGCGARPARWFGAPIEVGPVDQELPAVGHGAADDEERLSSAGAGTMSVGPPGTSGYDINPELRVRY